MQPTKEQENYKQLSLDLGQEETELKHPYECIISLGELKDGLESYYTSHSMLIGTPILCSNKCIVNWDKDKGGIWDDILDDTNPDKPLKYNDFVYTPRFNDELIEKERAKKPILRYIINYFYYDPKETPEQKEEIIKSLKEFKHPKKYIYDAINKKEQIEELTALELATCVYHRPYISVKDYWELIIKPSFKKVFTKEGLKELKKVYDSIKANTGTYLTRTIEEDVISELTNYRQIYYNNPELKSYRDFITTRIKKLEENYKQHQESYNTALTEIDKYFKANNTTIEQVKKDIEAKENNNYNDLIARDQELLRYYLAKRGAEEDLKRELSPEENREIINANNIIGDKLEQEEYNYINSLVNSNKGTLENFYYRLLELEKIKQLNNFTQLSINVNNQILNKIDSGASREAKINELLKHLLEPQYFYRNDRESALLEIYKNGEIAQQDNSTTDAIKYYGINTHKATKKGLEEYTTALENKKLLDKKLKELNTKAREMQILGAEELELKPILENIAQLKDKIKKLDDILIKYYVSNSGTKDEKILELRLTGTNLNNAKIVRDNNYIGYQVNDLKIVYPYNFKVDTQKLDLLGSQDFTLEYETLSYLSKTKEQLLQAYFTLILAKIPTDKNVFYFDYDELCEGLKLPKNKDGYTTIRELSALLGEIKISGKYFINKSKNEYKTLELTRLGLFRNDSANKKIYITLEAVYYGIFRNITSYITPNLEQRNLLSLTGANYYDYIVKTDKQANRFNKPHIIPLATFRDMNPSTNKQADRRKFYDQNIDPVYNELKELGRLTDYRIENLNDILKTNNEEQLQAKRLKINKKKKDN